MSEDEGTIGWREFDISRDHDVMSEIGKDHENDDEDEDVDWWRAKREQWSSEDTVSVTRTRKNRGSHEKYSKKDLLKY